jgi:PIN domain nuclease of toxin-antitoxin system
MLLAATMVSAVNWSEVLQKARARGVETSGMREDLQSLGMELVPFGDREAEAAADWQTGGSALALGDRACLATARVRDLPVVTADRAWPAMGLGVRIQLIR